MEVSFLRVDPTEMSRCLRTENENTAGTHLALIDKLQPLNGRQVVLMNLRLHIGHESHFWEVSSYRTHYQNHCAQFDITWRIELNTTFGLTDHTTMQRSVLVRQPT